MRRQAAGLEWMLAAAMTLGWVGQALAQDSAPPEHTISGSSTTAKPLLIPQIEGERQGKLVGRAIVCGTERARTDAALRAARDRMLARVGGPFTQDRYLPALDRALAFEASLGRPSDEACARAREAFDQFERLPG